MSTRTPTERIREIELAGQAVAAARENCERLKAEYKTEKEALKRALDDLEAVARPLPLFDGKEG